MSKTRPPPENISWNIWRVFSEVATNSRGDARLCRRRFVGIFGRINIPKTIFTSAVDQEGLSDPSARRLLVTSWCICDDEGRVAVDITERAGVRWGELLASSTRVELDEVVEDLLMLGFIDAWRERSDRWQVQRSESWMN